MDKHARHNAFTHGIQFDNNTHAQVGVWAPGRKSVALLVNDQQQIMLHESEPGYWRIDTAEIKPGDSYFFCLDDEKPMPDPASRAQPLGVHGASGAVDVNAFNWDDDLWKNPRLRDYIIYELHTGTFSPEGNFDGVIERLDHLVALGVTAIELMPVASFAGQRNWGYDGVFPFAAQESYGGPAGLARLVNACHKRNIAVILDVVYNHLGPEGNYLGAYAPYFTGKYNTPWGQAINFDDAGCDAVRDYFIQNALMWLRDFHIDALRLDAVHAIKDFSPKHILAEMKEAVNGLQHTTGRQHYLVVECDLNDTRFMDIADAGGYGIDAQWSDEFHHALRVAAGQEKMGYYADFSGIADLEKAYKDAYVFTGQYSEVRKKNFGVPATGFEGNRFVVFSQNHDQVGNRMLGERSAALHSFEMLKLLAGAVMISPYIPMLFMGEEWAEPNPFLYFTHHSDAALNEAVKKGRQEEFKSFATDAAVPDPTANDTFTRSKLQWQLSMQGQHAVMLAYYKNLINLRKEMHVINNCNREQMTVVCNPEANTLTLHRWDDQQHIMALLNFSDAPCHMVLPETAWRWKNVLDSASPNWHGPAGAGELPATGESILVQPASILIYTNYYV